MAHGWFSLIHLQGSFLFQNPSYVMMIIVLRRKHVSMCYKVLTNISMKSYKTFLLLVNYYNRLIMNLMRIPLDHSAAEGSSSGKSQLPEGATWEADSCHQWWCSPLSFYMCICIVIGWLRSCYGWSSRQIFFYMHIKSLLVLVYWETIRLFIYIFLVSFMLVFWDILQRWAFKLFH